MRKSRFTTEQIVGFLKEQEAGAKISDICRRLDISDNTFHRWKRKYGGMDIPDARRLKQLEDENRALKRIVAGQALNLQVVKDLLGKKLLDFGEESVPLYWLFAFYSALSVSQAFGRCSQRETQGARREETALALQASLRAAQARGVQKESEAGTASLPGRRTLGEKKETSKSAAAARSPMRPALTGNERWSIDFVRDTLADGRVFRSFTVVDDFTRECPAIEVDRSLPGERVARTLDPLSGERELPRAIVCDNGPEFQGQALDFWAHRHGVALSFIQPGKPVRNAFIESFSGKLVTNA